MIFDYGTLGGGIPDRTGGTRWSEEATTIDGKPAQLATFMSSGGESRLAANVKVKEKRDATTGSVMPLALLGVEAECSTEHRCVLAEKIVRSAHFQNQ